MLLQGRFAQALLCKFVFGQFATDCCCEMAPALADLVHRGEGSNSYVAFVTCHVLTKLLQMLATTMQYNVQQCMTGHVQQCMTGHVYRVLRHTR
jgi:hypothetical protein